MTTTLLDLKVAPTAITPQKKTRTIGPNWFGSVMGTGIVAVGAASLPVQFPGLRTAATVVWALAAAILLTLIVVWAVHLRRHTLRKYAEDPVMSQFWGAPPIALMTVGTGALLLGRDWIGEPAAVALDAALWLAGTLLGLAVAVTVPYLMITKHRVGPDAAFGAWLFPVVPPMVSAAAGALLAPHFGDRQDALFVLWGLFGVSLFAALIVIAQLWGRLMVHRAGVPRLVPTLWIVLGPLGQSVTAVHLIAKAGGTTQNVVLLYGVPVIGFALFWLALVVALTVHTVRGGLPFSLAWWSFTFPVGTVVTALSGLAARTGSMLLATLAVALYALLVTAWLIVAVRTLRNVKALMS